MGLTLHYTLRMKDMERLDALVEEVEDICQSLKWDSHRYDKSLRKSVSNCIAIGRNVEKTFFAA